MFGYIDTAPDGRYKKQRGACGQLIIQMGPPAQRDFQKGSTTADSLSMPEFSTTYDRDVIDPESFDRLYFFNKSYYLQQTWEEVHEIIGQSVVARCDPGPGVVRLSGHFGG